MCVCLIKVFIVNQRIVTGYLLNTHMSLMSLLSSTQKNKIMQFYDRMNLIDVYDLPIPKPLKQGENFEAIDLDKILEYCVSNSIDPSRVVLAEPTLNGIKNTPFLHVHYPLHLMTHYIIHEIPDTTPTKHFNFLAGNFHYDRFMLLQGLFEKDLLKDTHWSAYRTINTDMHKQHHFTNEFMQYCKLQIPRTMIQLDVHNSYPEEIPEYSRFTSGFHLNDRNNLDGIIFKDSAVTITVDSMANTVPGVYEKDWHDVEQKVGATMFYTAKIIKPIKHKRPFIHLIGKGKGVDKYLTDMGFKTFNSMWNEDYYNANTPKERVDLAVELCYNLSKLEVTEIHDKTKEICEHNYNVLTKTDWVEWYLNQIQTTLHIRQATT